MAAHLKKQLNLADVVCIAAGAMLSSGLFVLPGLAHARAGPGVVVSYLLAGLLAATGLLSVAELSTAMPKAGGDYYYIARGMGPAIGTVAGLLNWFSMTLKAAFALVGIGALAAQALGVNPHVVEVVCGVLFLAVNLRGVKGAARVQVAMVAVLLALMAVYVVFGLPAVKVQRFEPFAPYGTRSILSTAGFVFISYGGLLKIASISEEISRPARTIPLGMGLALLLVLVLYGLMVFITVGVLSDTALHTSLTPISDAAAVFMGRPGQIALAIGALLAFLTTANAGIMAASRYLLAMGRDQLLPGSMAHMSRRHGTPVVAVAVTGGAAILAVFVDLEVLIKAGSTVLILSYILSNLAIIVLRESRLQNYRPRFRAPLYPWVQLGGVLGFAFVVLEMGETAFAIAAALAAAGFAVYWFYGRRGVQQESALLHLVQRITARDLATGTLEAELKAVIRERDEIVLDRFDDVVEGAAVIDAAGAMDSEELFGRAADELSARLKLDRAALLAALADRERQSSTVIAPGLAVPHVIIQGQGLFDILLARSRAGFDFGPGRQGVHAVFVLLGTADERNFHLQALAAIAQIVQDADFERRWLAARGPQHLRDLVLLGSRRRNGR